MAKIILRPNNTTVNYIIESKSVETIIGKPVEDTIELVITPKNGYTIDAKDFTHGALPNPISSITYHNSIGKVIASIKFNELPITSEIINIYLPISGNLKRVDNTLVITSVTGKDVNIFESTTSIGAIQSTDINNNSVTYKITASTSGFQQVLSKTFSVPDGFNFETEPTYSISGNNSRYRVSIRSVKDKYNRIVRKVFEISYNFPEENPVNKPSNTITFKATSKEIEINRKEFVAEKKEDYKIYNVDYGRTIGLEGGLKHIKVNGVPGTKFNILVQDTNKNVYDFKSGGFKVGASFLKGTIPLAEIGVGYGTFNAFVKVDASTTATTISTRILTDAPTKITDSSGATVQVIPTVVDEEVLAETSMTLELDLDSVAYVVTRPGLESEADTLTAAQITGGVTNGTYIVGGGVSGTDIVTWKESNPILLLNGASSTYVWDITVADGKWIGINRQPRFDTSATFVDWDSYHADDSAKIKSLNSAGAEILTDFDNITTLSDWEIGMEVKVSPTEDSSTISAVEDDTGVAWTSVYRMVRVEMVVTAGAFGTADINPELNLNNFLTLVTIA